MLIERKKCPACTSLTFREIYRESYNKGAIKEYCIDKRYDLDILKDFYYDLLECKDCGLLYQKYIPNKDLLDLIYNKWLRQKKNIDIYDPSFNPYRKEKTLFCINEINRIIPLFNKPARKLKILDFGMGWASLGQIAKCMGMDVYGFDFATIFMNHANRNGIKTVDINNIKTMKFDFINTDQVFEHLTNPLDDLRLLEKSLKSNGIIKISVPGTFFVKRMVRRGVSSEIFNLKGTYFTLNAIAPLQHINGFTRKSIVKMGEKANLIEFKEPIKNIWKNSIKVVSAKNLIKIYLRPISRLFDSYVFLTKL